MHLFLRDTNFKEYRVKMRERAEEIYVQAPDNATAANLLLALIRNEV